MIKYQIYPTLMDSFYWAKRLGKWDELLNKINRVKSEMPPAASRGIAFEAAVNRAITNGGKTLVIPEDNALTFKEGEFEFNTALVCRIARKLSNCIGQQKYIEGVVKTTYGDVKMYGFVDYDYPDFYIDLKTTGSYKKGKYEINNQHKCYPLIGNKKSLTYLVTDFNDVYIEPYIFTTELHDKFIYELTEFIEWLEANRITITDKKIFNG